MNKTLTITFQKIDGFNEPVKQTFANAHVTLTVQGGGKVLAEENGTFLVYDLPSCDKYMCPITTEGQKLLSNILLVYRIFGLDWDKDMIAIVDSLKTAAIAKVCYELD